MLPENPRLPDIFRWDLAKAAIEEWAFKLLNSQAFVPPGTILEFGGTVAPAGYVLCDGSEYDQTKYEDLYKALGTFFGGTATTFNVPTIAAVNGRSWIIKV